LINRGGILGLIQADAEEAETGSRFPGMKMRGIEAGYENKIVEECWALRDVKNGMQPRQVLRGRHLVAGFLRAGILLARNQDAVEPDDLQDLVDTMRGIHNREVVARGVRDTIKRDQRGNTGGIDALDLAHVERDGIFANDRLQFVQQAVFLPTNEFMQLSRDGDC
jgi:hypothetical protein